MRLNTERVIDHMGSTRHEKSFVDFEKPYEQNVIGFRGIVYFGVGLFLLIVITFALMWALQKVLADRHTEEAGPQHPMMLNDRERLPPEPRLQLAPGWNVQTADGVVNLELGPPGEEYKALHKEWLDMWQHGVRDEKTGVISVLPIDEAKTRLLEQNVKARNDEAARQQLEKSRLYFTDASSGRVASEKRR
jgi:hypothetical protein